MHPSPTSGALAALRYWVAHAAGLPTPVPPSSDIQTLLRQTAWNTAGSTAPPGDHWPPAQDTPVASIFTRLNQPDMVPITAFLPPGVLRIEQPTIFPTTDLPPQTAVRACAVALRVEATAMAQRSFTPEAELEALFFILQRYAWALPSPLEAVALYDFARIHAALTAAQAAEPDGTFCLVGGDLSGVQEFIYSVPARGAAKQLRGRSFYLQLLTDACAHFVLTEAGMPLCNLLYAGGGRFYALLPGSSTTRLNEWRRSLGQHLLAAHHGTLYLALGATEPFTAAYENETQWQHLTTALDADKRRRFAALGSTTFAQLFAPRQPQPPRDENAEEILDRMGESLEQLGSSLSRAKVLILESQQARPFAPDEREHDYRDVLSRLGLRMLLRDEYGHNGRIAQQQQRILRLNDISDAEALPDDAIKGMRYTVTEARRATATDVRAYYERGLDANGQEPLEVGNVLPFTYLAETSHGVGRIGVLRMDVDDLGDLFGTKLDRPPGIAALAATAALSAALSRFFEGWVEALCHEFNQGDNGGIYAVYSGGDDLFLVGSWHLMPALARRIRDDFAQYILGRRLRIDERPPVTLSAGITLHNAGYPLYQAAADADEALDAAKRFSRPGGHRKDAITFLGQTLGWEQFAEVEQLHGELNELIWAGVPRTLLMVIQNLATQATQSGKRTRNGAAQFAYGPWIWQGAYQLTRMAERFGKSDPLRAQLADLCERLVGAEAVAKRTIERAGLAARWTQLFVRSRRDEAQADQEVAR